MSVRPALGQSSFVDLRAAGLTYVDKTREVADILDDPAQVLLITRPRRFGKTLLLTTLRAFVELRATEPDDWFAGTAIADDARVTAYRGRHPVIWLSFKEIKPAEADGLLRALANELRFCIADHPLGSLPELVSLADALAEPTVEVVSTALQRVTRALHRAVGERCVVLIDEYDTPLHAAWLHGYQEAALQMLRPLLSGALKDNPSLAKGVLTGITRIARESLFSGLNNLIVDSVLDRRFPTACGFTEGEVADLLARAGRSDRLDDVRAWYDGYVLAGVRLYNPWSILSWLADRDATFGPWWVNTGSDELLRHALASGAPELQADLEAILGGGSVVKPLVDHIVLRDLDRDVDAVWTLLVHAGYLQASELENDAGVIWARLRPPNHEVAFAWRLMFRRWLDTAIGGAGVVRALVQALLAGDAVGVERALQTFALRNLSALDVGGPAPERVWLAFLLGLLAHITTTHLVQSEAHAGFGRVDVLVLPRRVGAGAVIELKRRASAEEAEAALDDAMRQIDDRRYVDRLREVGASPAWKVAVAFAGQQVAVRIAAA